MTEKKTTVTPIGPSQVLVSRITHLQNLLQNLPEQLPLNLLNSSYNFFLDEESLAERGPFGTLSHILKVCFRTYENPQIRFSEHGHCLNDLISTIKAAVKTMSDSNHEAFHHKHKELEVTTQPAPPAPSTFHLPATTIIEKQQSTVIEITSDSDSESQPVPKCPRQSTRNNNVIIISGTSALASEIKPPLKQGLLNEVWKKRSEYTKEELAQA
ncbi:unnamed protein product [Cyclocybe aegerita]|uniref:Uncharacterized protein n=1 Tax=Cyclocybe aegerita TaxID=1973307 RepID=A0A8S0VSR0_CYCAE|nr:unnamed protein product [Cyclocybe aegerita]